MAEIIRIEIPIEVIDNTDDLDNIIRKLDKLEQRAVKASNQVRNSSRSMSESFSSASSKVSAFDKTAEKTQKSLTGWVKQKYQLLVEAKDRASPVIDKIKSTVGSLAGRAWRITVGVLDKVTSPIRSILSGLNSVLGMFGLGLSFAGGIVMPLKLIMEQQSVETAFEVLLGSADAAKQRVDELTTFAGSTPYTRDEIYEASRVLQVFTGDTLSTGEGLKMVGDIASGTKQEFGDVALWVGRLYDAMSSGNAIGEMTSRLQEMGAINGEARTRLEELAKSGKSITEIWPEATKEFSRFDGMMEKMSGNLSNLLLGVKSFVTNNIMKPIGSGLTSAITPVLEKFRQWRKENPELIAQMAENIEKSVGDFADSVVNKVTGMIEKVSALMNTQEFQDADLFGKIKIAWDELIGNPFSEWWEGTGKTMVAEKMGDIGKGLGTGISNGILTLLGIDVSGVEGEATSIGASFAKGFAEGFDGEAVKEAVMNAIKGIFSSAGKILPGGESPDISSWISAALIAKAASPLLSMGKGAFSIGKAVTGSATGGLLGKVIGSASTGAEIAGTGMMTGSGLMGGLASIGAKLGGAGVASSGAGLAALGAGSVAGGVAAAATLFSSFKDYKEAFTTDDTKKSKVYQDSGAAKLAGVGAGAAIGTMILPGVGTLVGAGIGGIVGYLGGEKIKENYEEELRKAEAAEEFKAAMAADAAKRLAISQEKAKYETKEMKQAVEDVANGLITSEQASQILSEQVGKNLKSHFGDIELSMQEIAELSEKLVYGDKIQEFERFSEAAEKTEQSMVNLKSTISSIDKLNWKAGLGLKLNDTEIDSYKAGMDELVQNALTYLEDKHYEAKVSIDLLFGTDGNPEFMSGIDETYATIQEELNGYGNELSKAVSSALEDGIIDVDEQKIISEYQEKIMGIMNQISNAENEAKLNVLELKFGGAGMTVDSFKQLQGGLQEYKTNAEAGYLQAAETAYTNLNYERSQRAGTDNPMDLEEYNTKWQEINAAYDQNIADMNTRMENFQLDAIANAYAKELDGILPEMKGSTSEKLGAAMKEAMANGVDPTTWGTEEGLSSAVEWLGLENLGTETQQAIAEMMGELAKSMPEDIFKELMGDKLDTEWLTSDLVTKLNNLDLLTFDGLGENVVSAIKDSILAKTSAESFEEITGPLGTSIGNGIGSAISNTDMSPINSAIDGLKSNTGTAIDAAYAPGFNTTTGVTITADYKLANPTATISFSGGGSGTATVNASIASNAEGSIVNGPLLSWVGEDGPEAIIPLGSKRRGRGLSLWEKAGELLGVKKYANGGVIGQTSSNSLSNNEDLNYISKAISSQPRGYKEFSDLYGEDETPDYAGGQSGSNVSPNTGGMGGIQISVNMSPTFEISGEQASDESSIVSVLKSHIREMADELGDELAERLQKVFNNMPTKEA